MEVDSVIPVLWQYSWSPWKRNVQVILMYFGCWEFIIKTETVELRPYKEKWKDKDFTSEKIESELILEANDLQFMKQDLSKVESVYLSSASNFRDTGTVTGGRNTVPNVKDAVLRGSRYNRLNQNQDGRRETGANIYYGMEGTATRLRSFNEIERYGDEHKISFDKNLFDFSGGNTNLVEPPISAEDQQE
ncbi:hypothetical protein HNY73_013069 [Argiope bruennichi]|uniref:Uncharacterized protein n=1 Tax=Argiope bruennichi TaxID=94029 RepID=A0A8T0EWW8_ARGBR|nr:hypothetical protein HNY73_013069 [Argiope bruennichi]